MIFLLLRAEKSSAESSSDSSRLILTTAFTCRIRVEREATGVCWSGCGGRAYYRNHWVLQKYGDRGIYEQRLGLTCRGSSICDCAYRSPSMRRKCSCNFREWLTSRWSSAIVRFCDSIVSAWWAIYDAKLVFIHDIQCTYGYFCLSQLSKHNLSQYRHANDCQWVEGHTAALESEAASFHLCNSLAISSRSLLASRVSFLASRVSLLASCVSSWASRVSETARSTSSRDWFSVNLIKNYCKLSDLTFKD